MSSSFSSCLSTITMACWEGSTSEGGVDGMLGVFEENGGGRLDRLGVMIP